MISRSGHERSRLRLALMVLAAAAFGAASAVRAQLQERPKHPEPQPAIPNTLPGPAVQPGEPSVTPDEGPLVAPGPPPDIILIYTGRVVGYVEPCG